MFDEKHTQLRNGEMGFGYFHEILVAKINHFGLQRVVTKFGDGFETPSVSTQRGTH